MTGMHDSFPQICSFFLTFKAHHRWNFGSDKWRRQNCFCGRTP